VENLNFPFSRVKFKPYYFTRVALYLLNGAEWTLFTRRAEESPQTVNISHNVSPVVLFLAGVNWLLGLLKVFRLLFTALSTNN
jgi:hypothetical protein